MISQHHFSMGFQLSIGSFIYAGLKQHHFFSISFINVIDKGFVRIRIRYIRNSISYRIRGSVNSVSEC